MVQKQLSSTPRIPKVTPQIWACRQNPKVPDVGYGELQLAGFKGVELTETERLPARLQYFDGFRVV